MQPPKQSQPGSLPAFSEIGDSMTTKSQPQQQENKDGIIPNSQPSSPKESSAVVLRSNAHELLPQHQHSHAPWDYGVHAWSRPEAQCGCQERSKYEPNFRFASLHSCYHSSLVCKAGSHHLKCAVLSIEYSGQCCSLYGACHTCQP